MNKSGKVFLLFFLFVFIYAHHISSQCTEQVEFLSLDQDVLTPTIYKVSDTTAFKMNPCNGTLFSENGTISSDEVLNDHWYYIVVGNKDIEEPLILELDNSQTDIIDIYNYSDGNFSLQLAGGDLVPFGERQKKHRNIIFLFTPEKTGSVLLLNIQNRGTFGIPVNIYTQEHFVEMDGRRTLILGMYLGLVILFILLVSASLVLADYNHTHFFYLLYLIFTGLYFFVELGYGDIYFWPGSPQLEEPFILAFVLGSSFSFLMLVYHLFNVRNANKNYLLFFKILTGCITAAIILLLSGQIKNDLVFTIQYYLVLGVVSATFLFALVMGYDAVKRNVAYAKYFLLAFSIMILGIVSKPFSLLGIIPFNNFVHYGGIIGHSFEIICLSTLLLLEFFRRMQYSQNLETQIVKLEVSALQAQMNPHFIFNCLNSIQNYIALNEKRKAMDYLTQFARLIRNTLNASASQSGTITLQEEIEMLENYVQLEQMRFKGKFDYRIVYDDELDLEDIEIPPMMIQPFVENAIIHGFKGLKEKGKLTISFQHSENDLIIVVEDNGVGYHPEKSDKTHKSMAMSITGQRLEFYNLQSDENENIQIDTGKNNKGTIVTIRIQQSNYE